MIAFSRPISWRERADLVAWFIENIKGGCRFPGMSEFMTTYELVDDLALYWHGQGTIGVIFENDAEATLFRLFWG